MIDSRDRRFSLYEIMSSLEYGMPHPEVEKVIQENGKSYIKRAAYGQAGIRLAVTVGLAQELYLFLQFNDAKLISAVMHGEDSPTDRFGDQPHDILEPSADHSKGG